MGGALHANEIRPPRLMESKYKRDYYQDGAHIYSRRLWCTFDMASNETYSDDSEEEDTQSEVERESTSSQPSDDEKTDDSEDESSDEEFVWTKLQDEAMLRHNAHWEELVEHYEKTGNTQEVSEAKATNDLIPSYRKELRQVLFEKLKWMHRLKRDPYFKKIKGTMENLKDIDGFDWREATQAAIEKRKFLLNKLFKMQPIPKQPDVPKRKGRFYNNY